MRWTLAPVMLVGLVAIAGPAAAYEFVVEATHATPGQQLLFTDTGGSLVDGTLMSAALPVTIFSGGYAGPGLLSIAFDYAPSTVRTFYPGPDPFVKSVQVRQGATLVGKLASIDIQLTAFDAALQQSVSVLHIHNDNPTTPFGVLQYRTYHSDGRGLVLPSNFRAAIADTAYLQGGNCHLSFCTALSPIDFSLSSDVLDLGSIRPGSDSAFALFLGPIGSAFTAGPSGPFTVEFERFIYRASLPEPASWALMIGGFGAVGMVMRRRRGAGMGAAAGS